MLTRFRLRSAWQLVPCYLLFRRVRRDARPVDGLLHAGFFVQSPRTCFSFSMWTGEGAIVEFASRVASHVEAARWAFGATFRDDLQRPEIFSTQWRLEAASNNLNWEGIDLRSLISPVEGAQALSGVQVAPGAKSLSPLPSEVHGE